MINSSLGMSVGGLSKLYKFITGTSRFTPLGMDRMITIRFKHGCPTSCNCRPTASTCEPSLTLPVHKHDLQSFEEVMASALKEGVGFGLI